MRRLPSIVPEAADRDVYLVLDDFGGPLGRAWRETDENNTDRQTIITDLLDGQYSNPSQVVAFNTTGGWSRDVSAELADEIAKQCWSVGFEVPPYLKNFVQRNCSYH